MWLFFKVNYPYLLKALFITLAIELAMLFVMKERRLKVFALAFAVNVVTNLTMNLVINFIPFSYALRLCLLELAVLFVETLVYWAVYNKFLKALLVATLCNAASLIVGFLI